MTLLDLYLDKIKPINKSKKQLWYRLYKHWHEPYIDQVDEEDAMKLFKNEMEMKIQRQNLKNKKKEQLKI